jgi:SNF2 family DNA or RNA helicase
MLVLPDKKAIILKLSDPTKITSIIPTAKEIEVRGARLVAVPHRFEETKVLRNLGFQVPAPILYQYDWPGRFTPYDHQRMTAAFLTMHHKGIVLNQIGTGKTNSALWAADYLMKNKKIRKCLIVSPLSTLERVWGDAIFTGFPNRLFTVLHGAAERRKRLLRNNVDFYIINHDGLSVILNDCRGMFDLVIVDEAAVLRNPSTARYKAVKKVMEGNPTARLWLMTGTPTPNEPTDAWALAKLVESPMLTKGYTAFRDEVMMRVGQWRYLPRPNSPEIVSNVLTPSVLYTREECLDLPDTVFHAREAAMTKEQQAHFDKMIKHFVVETQQNTITAVNEAVKLQKLIQIACGVAYDDLGNHVELDCSPRVQLVKDIIEEVEGKVIVFVPLTGTLNLLERELSKIYTVGVVNGAVSATKRNQIFHDFQHTSDPRILIAHPATMAHGLTLTAASTIVWYGPVNSNEIYTQANGRIERIGKRHAANVFHIEATRIERAVYERLKNKQTLQGVLLDMLRTER